LPGEGGKRGGSRSEIHGEECSQIWRGKAVNCSKEENSCQQKKKKKKTTTFFHKKNKKEKKKPQKPTLKGPKQGHCSNSRKKGG